MVPTGARVADVGTDHGLVPIALVDRGRASWCVAIDTDDRVLRPLRARLARDPIARPIEVRTGDGLAPVTGDDRIDTVILAGLGSDTVIRILERSEPPPTDGPRWILQPQTGPDAIRAWLRAHDHVLVDERIVEERGRPYLVLAAEPGVETGYDGPPGLEPDDLYAAGPLLVARRDPVALATWIATARRLDRIVEGLPPGSGERVRRDRARAHRIVGALGPA